MSDVIVHFKDEKEPIEYEGYANPDMSLFFKVNEKIDGVSFEVHIPWDRVKKIVILNKN